MSDEITQWVRNLAQGDELAAQVIFERYFEQLVRSARRHLGAHPRRAVDEEDVALSAMNSFYRGVVAGRFPQLEDRADVRTLLFTITARKAAKQIRRATAQKRGGGHVRGESVLLPLDTDRAGGIEQVLGKEPTPEVAAMIAESCRMLLDELGDDTLRRIVLLKLEGFSNKEIATQFDCAERTVERKLKRIRALWEPGGGASVR